MRRTLVGSAAVLVALAGSVPATARAPVVTVEARPDNTFAPAEVHVRAGEEVEWRNRGGFHNVAFDDGSYTQPAVPEPTPWTVRRRFDQPGTFAYVCRAHRDQGMRGTVTVTAPEQAPPSPDPEPPPPPPEPPPEASPARVTGFRVAARRRAVAVRFTLDRAARVTIRARRLAGGRGRVVRRSAAAGANAVRVSGLRRGRHRVSLAVAGGQRLAKLVRVR